MFVHQNALYEEILMNCVVCGSKSVYDEIIDQSYLFNNVAVVIERVRQRRCDDCKKSMLTFNEAVRVSKLHLAHNRKVVNLLNQRLGR